MIPCWCGAKPLRQKIADMRVVRCPNGHGFAVAVGVAKGNIEEELEFQWTKQVNRGSKNKSRMKKRDKYLKILLNAPKNPLFKWIKKNIKLKD